MSSEQQRVMALDVGDARIGVAVSDPLGLTAQPLCTVANTKKSAIREIIAIVQDKQVRTIVIGNPLELDARHGEQAEKVRVFHDRLARSLSGHQELKNTRLVLWDERFTTVQAERILVGSKLKNQERRAALDRVSAAIILESFLSSPQT